jgi:phosphoglycerate dehydrogenase-like enzyme
VSPVRVCIADGAGRPLLGDLPDLVEVEIGAFPGDDVEIWVPAFLRQPTPDDVAGLRDHPRLRVVQLLTAGVDGWLRRVPAPIALCDARGVHSSSTAEWAVAAILAYVREFPYFIQSQHRREWAYRGTGELAGRRVLVVGAGSIGEAVADRLAPFDVELVRVARQARAGVPRVHGVDELPALLPRADIVVLTVPLTPATRRFVGPEFLAAMPDGALLVNAARGPVVDSAALAAELVAGRLGAALDVTDPEPLPADDPLWTLPNVLLTPHVAASVTGASRRAYRLVGDQIRRYVAGEPLINVVTGDY